MNLVLISAGLLGVVALLAAVLLYYISKAFQVEEDPRIDLVQAVLPGANCGGCGFAGCRAFAEACVKAEPRNGLSCPVGGDPTMDEVEKILTPQAEGAEAPAAEGGEKKGFDPAVAAKIKALPTPKAVFPNSICMAQKS
jgi:RnfABCDGE-type electron transport complex B subunit